MNKFHALRCAACHFWQSPSSANLNPFGLAFQANKNLSAIAGGDADGDGRSNNTELGAGTLPGMKPLPPTGAIAASDGTYTDKVRINWSAVGPISGKVVGDVHSEKAGGVVSARYSLHRLPRAPEVSQTYSALRVGAAK